MSERRMFKQTPADPNLAAMLEAVKSMPPMTAEQRRAQRRSWVIGEMMLEHPEMTREYVEGIFNDIEG